MPPAPPFPLTIGPVSAADRVALVRLLAGGAGAADAPAGDEGSGLFEGRRGERVVGVSWARIRPGRVAEVLPPKLMAEDDEAAEGLLGRVDEFCRGQSVRVAHVYLGTEDLRTPRWLDRAGYRYASDMLLLARPLDAIPERSTTDGLVSCPCSADRWGVAADSPGSAADPTGPASRGTRHPRLAGALDYEPCLPQENRRLVDLLTATQVESLDFPILNGVLPSSDLVAGYQATGQAGRRFWRFARRQGRDVGCLLLADHARRQMFELLYLGLVPSARGRGWGRALVQHGLHLAGEAGREQMVVAVDAANEPAIATYSAESFVVRDRKRVWLRVF